MKGKLRTVVLWYVMAETRKVSMALSETSDMSYDLSFPCYYKRYPSACVPRGIWNETGAGVERSLRVASRDSAQCSDDWDERQVRFVLITLGAGADRGCEDHDCKFRAHEMPEAPKTVNPALFLHDVQATSLDVGGKFGSRDVGYPIQKVREELHCQVENDTAEGPVVKTMRVLLAPVRTVI